MVSLSRQCTPRESSKMHLCSAHQHKYALPCLLENVLKASEIRVSLYSEHTALVQWCLHWRGSTVPHLVMFSVTHLHYFKSKWTLWQIASIFSGVSQRTASLLSLSVQPYLVIGSRTMCFLSPCLPCVIFAWSLTTGLFHHIQVIQGSHLSI